MKRFLSVLIIGTIISYSFIRIHEGNADVFVQNENEVKNVVENYLKEYTESQVKFKKPNLENYISDKKTKEYLYLKNEIMQNRIKSAESSMEYYNIDLQFKDISLSDNKCIINIISNENIQFKNVQNETLRCTKHLIELEKENNVWKINKDISNDIVDTEVRESYISIEDLKKMEDKDSQSRGSDEIRRHSIKKESNERTNYTRSQYKFDRVSMLNYMRETWDKFPKRWGNFDQMGGDCTNYASQVIHSGGAPMDRGGKWKWYYYGYNDRSPSWTSVTALYNYLINNDHIGPQAINENNIELLEIGDLVQIDRDMDGIYNHTVIIVNPKGDMGMYPTVAAHSNPVFNEPLYSYTPSNIRGLKLTGYMK